MLKALEAFWVFLRGLLGLIGFIDGKSLPFIDSGLAAFAEDCSLTLAQKKAKSPAYVSQVSIMFS